MRRLTMPVPSILLTLNAGPLSVKFAAYGIAPELPRLALGQVDGLGAALRLLVGLGDAPPQPHALHVTNAAADHLHAVHAILWWLHQTHPGRAVRAVSHQVAHGGMDLVEPVRIDEVLVQQLERLVPMAPGLQPHNLQGIRAAQAAFPDALQVACFDTAFHRGHHGEGIRRHSFHGLSCEYISRRLRESDPMWAHGRVIVAHLGNGASMCAMQDGRPVASSKGFTALDGLPIGTLSGQPVPGKSQGVRAPEISNHRATSDALSHFAEQGRREIGGLASCLGGIDALVMTGGIGENAARVRSAMLTDMEWMGINLDHSANQVCAAVISRPSSRVQVMVIKTDEERMLAEHAVELLST